MSDDGGFDDGAVLTPEQLAELLAGMPDLGDPELPDLSEPEPAPLRAPAPPMIGFVDGPTVVPEPARAVRDAGAVPDRAPARRTDPHLAPDPAPALDPAAAESLSWLFR